MSTQRPTVSPQLVAAMIESTPDRVRRRLDRAPDAASSWDWRTGSDGWSVDTGGETVTLPPGYIATVEQVTCTCLLSPRCFHVLACLTRLEVAIIETIVTEEAVQVEPASSESESDDDVVPDEKQRHAARELVSRLAQLLQVGVANAGVVVQSGLLRAVHQCRADGLHRLSSLGLRIITGTRELRARAAASDPAQLAEDVADALETSRHVLARQSVAGFWIGTARRPQIPVRPRKLHGLFAEPIMTRSGFSGAAVYFLGEDDQIYSASDVRPGDAQHARDAYLGGIEIGPLIQPAKQLARGLYLGTDLTASRDGRLGRGKSIKVVEQGTSAWQREPIQKLFQRPLPDQWNLAFEQAALPADAHRAGWDFVYLQGIVLGAAGAELLFQPTSGSPIFLAIDNESESLYFRENLRMLSHAPGLRLQMIARVNLQKPSTVNPLAITQLDSDARQADEPRLEIPTSLGGRACLGYDEIQRNHLVHAQALPAILNAPNLQTNSDHSLAPLRRRWIAALLSGLRSQRPSNTNMLASETAMLARTGFATGAALLDSLSRSHAEGPSGIDSFLATAVYLRHCSCSLAKPMPDA